MNKEELEEIEITLENCKPYNELGTYTHFNCESIEQLLQERNNYKELYEKENKNWNELKEWIKEQDVFITELPAFTKEISIEHKIMAICYENILDKMEDLERGAK